jgi:ribosome-associated protein
VARLKKPTRKKAAAKKAPAKKPPARRKPARKPVGKKPAKSLPRGLPERLRDAALKVLDDRQAEEIVTFDLGGRSSVADYLIVASGRASRQLAAIAHYLSETFAALGVPRTRVEGLPEANWVLVDCGDVIVHLFRPEVRGYYNLEGIWGKRGKT